jgi:hypothetical protein
MLLFKTGENLVRLPVKFVFRDFVVMPALPADSKEL